MPPRRIKGSSLDKLTPLERSALENGFSTELVFDSDDHHRATWESVKDELLAHYVEHRPGERPESWFVFVANDKFGPRRTWNEEKISDSGNPYISMKTESDYDYLVRHGLLSADERHRAASHVHDEEV